MKSLPNLADVGEKNVRMIKVDDLVHQRILNMDPLKARPSIVIGLKQLYSMISGDDGQQILLT